LAPGLQQPSAACVPRRAGVIAAALAAAAMLGCGARRPAAAGEHRWTGDRIMFSGRAWRARQSEQPTGAGPIRWAGPPEGVVIDAAGRLHLRLTERGGRWYGAEVRTPLPDAYGRLEVALELPRTLPVDVVAGVFIYHDDASEIDLELGRWGDATAANAQYVVQPNASGRLVRFDLPLGRTRHVITWSPDEIRFASTTDAGAPVAAWAFDGAPRPHPGSHYLHLNLWFLGDHAGGQPAELIVDEARFIPAAAIPSRRAPSVR
jgi:hypothetical protein